MKIVSGSLRGMTIKTSSESHVRPTLSKVREALASILLADLEDAVFVDLFAGSGAVGLEMLSAGVSQCLFYEKDRLVVKILNENIKLAHERLNKQNLVLGKTQVINKDISKLAKDAPEEFGFKQLIIWADPPYIDGLHWAQTIKQDLAPIVLEDTKLIFEFDSKIIKNAEPAFYDDSHWETVKIKHYGHTSLIIWRKKDVKTK